ncbi:hypothetical protein PIROE2DRAFT_8873 [Piromyces sp. E2]|nr:hypothetical protein PIROE2DRAFT_8873 [Piromyces sp. E2]|eukprot:OUM64399.1 hypothetical protein PIROE2DRAFT_8873 [Piromyces sp. E2]
MNNWYKNLSSTADGITEGNLQNPMCYDTVKQRFGFGLNNGCQFCAYYDKIIPTKLY